VREPDEASDALLHAVVDKARAHPINLILVFISWRLRGLAAPHFPGRSYGATFAIGKTERCPSESSIAVSRV
jgi:hypothetical protein